MPLLEPDPGALRPDVRPQDASSDRVTDAGAGGTPSPSAATCSPSSAPKRSSPTSPT